MKNLLALAMLSAGISATAAVSFSTDFESPYTLGALNGQDGWAVGYYTAGSPPFNVQDTFAFSGTQSAGMNFQSNNEATGGYAWQYLGHDPTDPEVGLELSYKFRMDGTNPNDTTLANYSFNKFSDGSGWFNMQFQSSGNPIYDDSMWMVDSTGFNYMGSTGAPRGEWHTVKVRYNQLTGLMNTWLNGEVSYRPWFMTVGTTVGWSNMLSYAFAPSANQSVSYDDVDVKSIPDRFLTGTVDLEGFTSAGYVGPYTGFVMWTQAKLYQAGVLMDSAAGFVDTTGVLTMDIGAPDGTYDIIFDGWYCLKGKTTVTIIGGTGTVNLVLRNGDTDGNEVVDLTDYTNIATAFNGLLDEDPATAGNQPSANFLYEADLTGDGVVDLTDYTLVATNFNALSDVP